MRFSGSVGSRLSSSSKGKLSWGLALQEARSSRHKNKQAALALNPADIIFKNGLSVFIRLPRYQNPHLLGNGFMAAEAPYLQPGLCKDIPLVANLFQSAYKSFYFPLKWRAGVNRLKIVSRTSKKRFCIWLWKKFSGGGAAHGGKAFPRCFCRRVFTGKRP
jgi:hypothetical protein